MVLVEFSLSRLKCSVEAHGSKPWTFTVGKKDKAHCRIVKLLSWLGPLKVPCKLWEIRPIVILYGDPGINKVVWSGEELFIRITQEQWYLCLGSKDAYGARVILDFCKKLKVQRYLLYMKLYLNAIGSYDHISVGIDNPQVVGEGFILATMH